MKIYQKILSGFGITILFITISGVLNFRVSSITDKNAGWYAHSEEVIHTSSEMKKRILDMETGIRGVLLTHDTAFFQPYDAARTILPGLFRKEEHLIMDNPQQVKQLQIIKNLYNNWFDNFARPFQSQFTTYKPGNFWSGEGKSRIEASKLMMDRIRSAFDEFDAEEYQLRAERINAFQSSLAGHKVFITLSILLAAIAAILTALYISNDIRRSLGKLSIAAKQITAGDYSAHVQVSTKDELAEFAIAFNNMAATIKDNFEKLRISNEELEQFAWVTSHDLKEPLRMITLYIQLLSKKHTELDEESRTFINFALEGAKRMKLLITGMLDYSKISKSIITPDTVDTRQLVDHVVESLRLAIDESDTQIIVSDLPDYIRGVESLLAQVFQNLIQNAIKFRDKHTPVIHINCSRGEGFWHFSIQDNGIGVHRDFHEKIFGIFQRLHDREQYSGTGIGLATCRRIIEMHGGSIWLESAPGEGSTFHFTLPVL